jgi:hypothetical protein
MKGIKMKTILCAATVSLLGVVFWSRGSGEMATETYCGSCDASAVVALDQDKFVVADDEDSVMRIYSRARGGPAIYRTNLSAFLGFQPRDEADVEGSARIGNRLYWITSHGNNRKGKEQESRQRFFAVTVQGSGDALSIQTVGRPYTGLLDDLLKDPRLLKYGLHAALNLPPKTPGALNIEGLTATPDGHLLIGFRNPVPNGGALLVPLLNPNEVIQGQRARFGEPHQLSLGGYGIRSIEPWRNGYLIVAGSIDGKGKSRLYEWSGGAAQPQLLPRVNFSGINPEALSIIERDGVEELFVVSDDGTRLIDGIECKKIKDPMKRMFRATGVVLGTEVVARQ